MFPQASVAVYVLVKLPAQPKETSVEVITTSEQLSVAVASAISVFTPQVIVALAGTKVKTGA